jgi:hypothetical protein
MAAVSGGNEMRKAMDGMSGGLPGLPWEFCGVLPDSVRFHGIPTENLAGGKNS